MSFVVVAIFVYITLRICWSDGHEAGREEAERERLRPSDDDWSPWS